MLITVPIPRAKPEEEGGLTIIPRVAMVNKLFYAIIKRPKKKERKLMFEGEKLSSNGVRVIPKH